MLENQHFILLKTTLVLMEVQQLSCDELQTWLKEGRVFQLIDVRTVEERNFARLDDDLHIPVERIMDDYALVARDRPVVIYCRSGVRSAAIGQILVEEFGIELVYNLRQGILGWRGEIITSIIPR